MEELFGTLGSKIIASLIGILLITIGLIWKGVLGRIVKLEKKIDQLYEKLDAYIKSCYEERNNFVSKSYMENDIKPWIRGLEADVKENQRLILLLKGGKS